jgi:hypothetical protein
MCGHGGSVGWQLQNKTNGRAILQKPLTLCRLGDRFFLDDGD